METIMRAFPNGKILIPYRTPEQHAFSLLKQHQLFCKRHQQDPFTKKYMGWLVHHEFGEDHRPFEWGGAPAEELDTATIDYWLAQWIWTYTYLEDHACKNTESIQFVSYDRFCTRTDEVWLNLTDFIGLESGNAPAMRLSQVETPVVSRRALLDQAMALYKKLNSL